MDLMAAVQEFNSSASQRAARAARRELRDQLVYSRIGQALGRDVRYDGETQERLAELDDLDRLMRTAAGWNLPVGEEVDDGAAIGNQHPGAAALVLVRHALSEYSIPTDVELRYHGMKRASGHGAFGVNDGIVYVQATLHSISGPRHHVDIPVVMRQGRVLAPSILLHQGTARILTQHTFDDIIGMGEFTAKAPDRPHMYAPGPDKDAASPPQREIPRLSPNMFKPLPSRNLIRGALTGVHQGARPRRSGPPASRELTHLIQAKLVELRQTNMDAYERLAQMGGIAPPPGGWTEKEAMETLHMLEGQLGHQARRADWDSIAPEPDPQMMAQVMELATQIQKQMRCDMRQAILEAVDQLVPAGGRQAFFRALAQVQPAVQSEEDYQRSLRDTVEPKLQQMQPQAPRSLAPQAPAQGYNQEQVDDDAHSELWNRHRGPANQQGLQFNEYMKQMPQNAPDKPLYDAIVKRRQQRQQPQAPAPAPVAPRRGFYNPDIFGLLENGSLGKDVPGAGGSHVDVGERPTKDMLAPGQRVRIKTKAVARDRGGVSYAVPYGSRGTVVRDVDGAGRAVYVKFEELGFSCVVPREALSG